MTWVWRDGALVEKTIVPSPSRSSLPCPNIIRDGLSEPLQHMVDGRWYDSKRAMAKATREAGCVEIGNDKPEARNTFAPACTKDEVVQAYQKVKEGYKPAVQVEKAGTDTGWI